MMSDSGTPEPIGYGKAVQIYRDLGWIGVLPMRRGFKKPPPSIKCPKARAKAPDHPFDCPDCVHYTGHYAINPSGADITAWCEQFPIGNLCLHLPDGLVAIDVDAYGTKTGAAALAEATRRWGQLPYAPRSTSRDDPHSGIRIFSVPPGTVLEDRIVFPELGIGDIEWIQSHHRYVNAWPSIHPEGPQYWWRNDVGQIVGAPAPDDAPSLPQPWIEGNRVVPRNEIVVGDRVDIGALLTPGDMSPIVQARLSQAIGELNLTGQSRHDTACRHVLALMRMGKMGEAGVGTALKTLCNVLVACRQVDKSSTPEETVREFERMVFGERAARELSAPGIMDWIYLNDVTPAAADTQVDQRQLETKPQVDERQTPENQSPPSGEEGGDQEPGTATESAGGLAANNTRPRSQLEELERGFWQSRQSLAQVYQTAMARMAAPWATLGVTAARALCTVRPNATLPPIVSGPGSLNFFVALVASSGGGKGAANGAASLLVPDHLVKDKNLGSGEGLVALFGRSADAEDPTPIHEALLINVDEVDTLTALGQRSGSTTMSVLRSAFMGEPLGFSYADKSKRRDLRRHTYRMTMVVSVQPKQAGPLLSDSGGGTPQRFMWFPAQDNRIPLEKCWPSTPLTLPEPSEWLYPREIAVPDEVEQTIRYNRWLSQQEDQEHEPLDGHALFCREKFAYALAIMDGRIVMTLEDWELSGIAAGVSAFTRQRCADQLREAATLDAMERGAIRGVEMEAADVEKLQQQMKRGQRVLNWTLHKLEAAENGWMTQSELISKINSRDRKTLAELLAAGHATLRAEVIDGAIRWSRG